MGTKPSNIKHEPYKDEEFKDIQVKSYYSKNDKIFEKFEYDLNFLKHISLIEFQQILYNYACTKQEQLHEERHDDISEGGEEDLPEPYKEYDFYVPEINFGLFLEKKVIKHFLVYPVIGNEEKSISLFMDFFTEAWIYIEKNYRYYLKTCKNIKVTKRDPPQIKKTVMISLAFLYCREDLFIHRINYLFTLFCDDDLKLVQSDAFEMFLIFLFLIPSNIYLITIFKLCDRRDDLNILTKEKFLPIYDVYQFKDCNRLLDLTLKSFFGVKKELSREEFKNKMKENDWVFSASGIRHKLETMEQ